MLKLRIGSGAPMLSPDGRDWCRLDAPRGAGASAPHAVVLTGATPPHVDGLLDWRHGAPLTLYSTPAVFERLSGELPLLPLLDQWCGVRWFPIGVAGDARAARFAIPGWPELTFDAHALDDDDGHRAPRIALRVRDAEGRSVAFCPRQAPDACTLAWMEGADCLLFGGDPPAGRNRRAGWKATFDALAAPRKLLLNSAAARKTREIAL